jgi:hypothetical protein
MIETNEMEKVEHVEVAAVEVNALEVMERAAVDVQIATAHRYPRDIDKFIDKAKKMVSVDEETAASCIYRRPVGKDDDSDGQKYVEGESIRLAEIIAANYGNLRIGVIISEMNPRYVKAIGYAHDLESNVANKAEVVESTVTKYGKPYSERMRLVVAKAAQSKARRDAIFSVVPKSLCKPIIERARQIISGNQKPLEQRREAVKIWLSKLAIEPARVFAALNVEGIHDLGNDELETLTGIRTALRDGEITLDEAFPPPTFKEAEKQSEKAIDQNAGSQKLDPQFDKQASASKGRRHPDSKKNAKKDEPPISEIPKFKLVCEGCGLQFDEPKQVKIGNDIVKKCPECPSMRYKENSAQGEIEAGDYR